MSEPSKSPLVRLVLVMVCLSIAGTLAACVHYLAVDIPQQKSLQVPENGPLMNYCSHEKDPEIRLNHCLDNCPKIPVLHNPCGSRCRAQEQYCSDHGY